MNWRHRQRTVTADIADVLTDNHRCEIFVEIKRTVYSGVTLVPLWVMKKNLLSLLTLASP